MSQEFTQSVAANVIVLLSKNSVAVTGLLYTDVTTQFSKNGGAFASKTLSSGNFTEVGLGVYTIGFTTTELNTLGSFVVIVTGATIDQSTTVASVVAAAQASTAVSLEMCVITGHVTDMQGTPKQGIAVSAQVLGMPSIEQNQVALTDDLVSVLTDANGAFFLPLARLVDVEITIPATNYRRRLVVPNAASADLFNGIP